MREWRLRLVLQQRLYLSAVEALGAEVEVAPTVAGGGRSRRGRRRGMVGALCLRVLLCALCCSCDVCYVCLLCCLCYIYVCALCCMLCVPDMCCVILM